MSVLRHAVWTAYARREHLNGRTPMPHEQFTAAFDGALRFARDAADYHERQTRRPPVTIADVIHKLVDAAKWFSEEAQAEAHRLVDAAFGKATDVSAPAPAEPESPGSPAAEAASGADAAATDAATTVTDSPAPVPTEEGTGTDPRAASATEPAGAASATDEGTTAPDATASAGTAAPAPSEASTVTEMYDAAGTVTGTFDSATGTFTPAA